MIAYLALFSSLTIHQAAATSLLSFLFTGVLGTWAYQQRGTIDWRITLPVCLAAVAAAFLGACVAALVDPRPLAIAIALLIVAAGAYVLYPGRLDAPRRDGRAPGERGLLALVGGVSGFGSGFSGAGGPLFAVPLMMILRYVPLTAVATSQVLVIVASVSGSIPNIRNGFVDWRVAAIISLFQVLGALAGVRLAHVASGLALRRLAAGLCIVSGALLLARSL